MNVLYGGGGGYSTVDLQSVHFGLMIGAFRSSIRSERSRVRSPMIGDFHSIGPCKIEKAVFACLATDGKQDY